MSLSSVVILTVSPRLSRLIEIGTSLYLQTRELIEEKNLATIIRYRIAAYIVALDLVSRNVFKERVFGAIDVICVSIKSCD